MNIEKEATKRSCFGRNQSVLKMAAQASAEKNEEVMREVAGILKNSEQRLEIGQPVWCIENPGSADMELKEQTVLMATNSICAGIAAAAMLPNEIFHSKVVTNKDIGRFIFTNREKAVEMFKALQERNTLEEEVHGWEL